MKRVLITGKGSYIGGWVRKRLEREPEHFEVAELDMRGDEWRSFDFSGWDAVFHVAGIAHVSTDPKMENLYYKVNRDLAVEVGKRAKAAGVKQFIFMSSAIVYGDSAPASEGAAIDLATEPSPANFYGRSKLEAERGLMALEDDSFKVAVLRCPMVYGPNCKGNFPALVRLAQSLPVFPDIDNRRSMLYVGNLSELVAQLVAREARGVFLPQDGELVRTSEMARLIAAESGHSMKLTKVFNPLLKTLLSGSSKVQKAFGSLYYDQVASDFGFDYRPYSIEGAIREVAVIEGWLA